MSYFLSLATTFLLGFSTIYLFTYPPPFLPNAFSTSVVAVALPRCTLSFPPSPASAILNRFPSLQHLVLVDSSEYMLSQSTSLLNARRSSLSSPLPAITTYPSLLSVLEEVPLILSFPSNPERTRLRSHLHGPFSQRTSIEQGANLRHCHRLGFLLSSSFSLTSQSFFALAARSSSPKPVRAGGFIWYGALDRWSCEWRRNRSERRCWRRVRTVRSVRCRTIGRTGVGLRSSASRGRRR